MFISLDWIKEFVNIPSLPPKELASRFTLSTAEVEDVKVTGQGLEKVQVVQVLSKKPHPEADKLNLVTFDAGVSGPREVVCGAPNVKEGMKVFYAPVGTTLPNGLTLEPKKIRGILSDGMLCSETELGLGTGSSGLMELPDSVAVGTKFMDYAKLKSDVILEVDNKSLTHRPDLWGHYGLAREFAASYGIPLKEAFSDKREKDLLAKKNGKGKIEFQVAADSSCWAYLGLNIEGVKVGPSPAWLKSRLESVGLRSINNIVDASNFVMWELGMPNHVFDADKIAGGKLQISRLGNTAKFKTLDEQVRDLVATDTVIADATGPSVLAGVMGGDHSGVSDTTTNVFLEVANWDPVDVRKTTVRLGLRTDSSQRFEKTLDSNLCRRSLLRLAEVILELSPGAQIKGEVQEWFKAEKLSKPLTLNFTANRITKVLGIDLPIEKIQQIFTSLDFKVDLKGQDFTVTVPTWRTTKDISCVDDLVEEIGRMIGYDNIAASSPLLGVRPVRLNPAKVLLRKIQDFMVLEGKALEVFTYPLIGADLLKKASWPSLSDNLVLVNALSQDQDRMRPSVIPSAIQVAADNQKHYDEFTFFEWGRAYRGFEDERTCLLVGMYSKEKTRFIELLNHVDRLMTFVGLTAETTPRQEKFPNTIIPYEWNGCHPHEYVNIKIQGKFQGAATTVHPAVLKGFKAKGFLSLAVIDFTDFEKREIKDKMKYAPIAKFPSSTFDVSVVAKSEVPAGDVLKVLQNMKLKFLKSSALVGIYPLQDGTKSVTLRSIFEDPEATLTPDFLKEAEKNVVQVLENNGFFLRG